MNDDTTLQDVSDRIDQDGFNYTFINFSDFKEVKDDTFHQLRKEYIEAAEKLEQYIKINK